MNLARTFAAIVVLSLLAACATPPPSYVAPPVGQLPLDSGDQLRITVLGQPDLSGTFTIDESGAIAMPLIGAVAARGQTASGVEGAIAAALRQGFLRSPDVTVQVEAYRPIFVMGEVATSGQYAYRPGLNVQQAIAIAGGFTPRANQNLFDVVRRVRGEPIALRLGLLDWVMPGDTIVVRQRLI